MTGRFDRVIRNARLWTDGRVLPGADALAIAGDRIAALGRFEDLRSGPGAGAEVDDARGATVTPGLTDAHVHLLAWARSLDELALQRCESAAACARLAGESAALEPGRIVLGRGWDANGWSDAPHRKLLDPLTRDVPVLLHSKDFHALWANGVALARAGVTRETPDPEGGLFERDASGEPTGVAREHAVRVFAPLLREGGALSDVAIRRAFERLHGQGITAIHDFEDAESLRRLAPLARLEQGLRVLAGIPHATLDEALSSGLTSGLGDDRLRIGAVKLFADGTLGSRTAAMLEPYDGTDGRGLDLVPDATLFRDVARALEGGIAVAIHAIGDRAVRRVLDAFAAARAHLATPALVSRIEHLQLVHPEDAPRLAELGLLASMQPSHCVSDIPLADRAWASRRAHAYAWRRFLELGVPLAFGSDAPVEPPSIGEGLACALTRANAAGEPAGGWVPGQRIALDLALEAYAGNPARAAGTFPRLGTLRPGAAADVVVWNRDLHGIEPAELRTVHSALTLLDGRVVHVAAS